MDSIILTIKDLMGKKNFTYEKFAVKIGKSKQTIINYLNGRSKIDIYTLKDIAEALEVPMSVFFEENPNISKKIIGDSNQVNIDSAGGKNTSAGVEELLKSKNEIIEVLKRNNEFYFDMFQSLAKDISNLYTDVIAEYPKLHNFLKQHDTTKFLLNRIKTYEAISGESIKLNNDFLKKFS